jgi:DNA-binding transcriptional regulator YiaG
MPDFTYLPGPDVDERTSTHGFTFTAGEWTPIPDEHPAVEKLRANRFFAERGEATNGSIPLGSSYPNAIGTSSAELHETGSAELPQQSDAKSTNVNLASHAVEAAPVDITPQQCKAARAGLDWSREQLAGAARIAERTLTDFERQASNMLRKNKVALRKAFEAAGVTFDASNGVWLPVPASENSTDNKDAEAESEPLAA